MASISSAFLQRSLTLRHMRLLLAVEELRQVGRVATALSISQPAVSKALAEIENGIGVPLFDRTPRGMLAVFTGSPTGCRDSTITSAAISGMRCGGAIRPGGKPGSAARASMQSDKAPASKLPTRTLNILTPRQYQTLLELELGSDMPMQAVNTLLRRTAREAIQRLRR